MIEALVRADIIEGIDEKRQRQIRDQGVRAAKQLEDPATRREAMKAALASAADLSQEPGDAPEFLLWKDNFEADNFTTAELCQVVSEFASEIGLSGFKLEPSDVQARTAREREAGREKAIASIVLELAAERDAGFRLSKPDFAQRLAQFVLAVNKETGESRPILDLAEHLVALTWASRKLQGGLRG